MDGVLGAIQHPTDGYIQPADLTQALAKGPASAARRSTATRP
jgi:glycine/D-amino acid oxidase-like deaminating enzyme